MPKRSSSKSDLNTVAARVVQDATGAKPRKRRKNPAAVALGRKGGLKGGKARALSLSPKERSEIAKRAAIARWSKPEP